MSGVGDRLRFLFRWDGRMSRGQFLAWGLPLAVVKYAIDAILVSVLEGRFWSPLDYSRGGSDLEPETLAVLLAVTVPFLWMGVTLCIRRAVDAGLSGWLGLLFLVPPLSYVLMLALCLVPTRARRPEPQPLPEPGPPERRQSVVAVGASATLGLVMLVVGAHFIGTYGWTLFFVTPFVMGAVAACLGNSGPIRSIGSTLRLAMASLGVAGTGALLLAQEGLFCLVMAAPLVLATTALGALVGRQLVLDVQVVPRGAAFVLLALPLFAGAERAIEPDVREVASAVEIDAPPEVVWQHVIGFRDIDAPPAWYFRLGIAHPVRARIVGSGVGAVRYCEFSTGAFVEPITTWDEPRRLAFDVVDQPPPMIELSPYEVVHAPHLDGTMRSLRGEFRLIPLDGSRTRLEGSTWYVLDMQPAFYWRPWAEWLVHAIHGRVLDHVKGLAEARVTDRPVPPG